MSAASASERTPLLDNASEAAIVKPAVTPLPWISVSAILFARLTEPIAMVRHGWLSANRIR